MQVPPMVSALRVDGKRLHELAREGIEVERSARPVTVHRFVVSAIEGDIVRVRVDCSSGTYVRSLALDLGRLLGGGAHVRALRRVAVGAFTIDDCVALDALGPDDAVERLLPVAVCVRALTIVSPDDVIGSAVQVGRVIPRSHFAGPPPWAVVDGGRVLAIFEPFANHKVGDDMARPVIVLGRQ